MSNFNLDALEQSNGRFLEHYTQRPIKRKASRLVSEVGEQLSSHLSSSYENWSWDDLYHEACMVGVKNCARLTRHDLIRNLKNF